MTRRLSAAVIATFSDAERAIHYRRLEHFSARQWEQTFHWLDASGLALYFLQRINALNLADALPTSILAQLQERYRDNQVRTAALSQEAVALNAVFSEKGLDYLNLKGMTLVPDYCPDLSLRCQLDNDFLIERRHAAQCREILAERGYRMIAATHSVMEFKTDTGCTPRIRDLYKAKPEKTVELHLCDRTSTGLDGGLLNRKRFTAIGDHRYPSLSQEDMFLSQAFHLFRHLRSEWTRISWLLEFKHFITTRDCTFWDAARKRASQSSGGALAVGVAIRMAEQAYGEFAPCSLTTWSCRQVPAEVDLWIKRYGVDVLLADFPGTKLYLLLERAIRPDLPSSVVRRALFPWHAPGTVVAAPDRGLRHGLRAFGNRSKYLLFRLRFHITEGLRYLFASWHWKYQSRLVFRRTLALPTRCEVKTAD